MATLDALFNRLFVFLGPRWASVTPTGQLVIVAGLIVAASLALLAWRDWSVRKMVLWTLDQRLTVEASQQYKDLMARHQALMDQHAVEMDESIAQAHVRARALHEETRAIVGELRDDIAAGRFPLQLLAQTGQDVELLERALRHARPEIEQAGRARVRVRVAGAEPSAPDAYAHMLDDAIEPQETDECPPKKITRRKKS